MTLTRREFFRAGTLAATGAMAGEGILNATARAPRPYFGLHSFIEKNPKAVFIRRTHVPEKMDAQAKLREGLSLAREIFVPLDAPGIPVTHRVILKPNICPVGPSRRGSRMQRTLEDNWGTATDPPFYEGLIMGIKELGVKKLHFVEANSFEGWNLRGMVDIHERQGVEMNEPERRIRNFRDGYEMTWSKVPDAVVYSRIPHYTPINEPDTWLFNIAKWKAHGMCLSQAVKNVQGLVILPYVRFCPGWKMVTGVPDFMKPDIHPRVEPVVNKFFERHLKLNYSRYNSKAPLGPMEQEIWAHKTCDNHSVLKVGLSMIEGICGRDGDGFGTGTDYLTNVVMFSKDPWRLDLVGLYLGGHEPGNVNLYRTAKERGLTDTFNPWEVEVYEWLDDAPVRRKLTDFTRTPLKTYYLEKEGEPHFHLVNEPFDYDKYKI